MGTAKFGQATWLGDLGLQPQHLSITRVDNILSVASYNAFISSTINPRTQANLYSRGYTELTIFSPVAPPGVSANIDRIAVIYFRDNADGRVYIYSFPAPTPTIVEDKPAGERIKAADVSAVVVGLATVTGKDLFPLYGVVYQRG